jgi:ABC-2 type transport system permease protein
MMVTGTLPPPATADKSADEQEEAPKGGGPDYGDQAPEGGGGGESAETATSAPATAPPAPRPIKVIMVSDVDVISETFFNLRRQGFAELNFDNVTFALNCIDVLAGDESFVALRKHRPRHRTLTRVEELIRGFADASREETERAETQASVRLGEAQQRLDQRVGELRSRTDLDERTKTIMLKNLEQVENRRLDVQKAEIDEEKQRTITRARTEMEVGIAGVQRTIKWWAALVPPIPALMLAVVMFAYRYNREKIGVSERRLVGAK